MTKLIKNLLRNFGGRKNLATVSSLNSENIDDSRSKNDDAVSEVWLYPESEELSKQSVLKARRIDQAVFRIGRRISGTVIYPQGDPPELLITEREPFTLSKLHCALKQDGKKLILQDLGSRSGTLLGKKRLNKPSREPSSVVVPKGSHSLILGHARGPFRFRLEVR